MFSKKNEGSLTEKVVRYFFKGSPQGGKVGFSEGGVRILFFLPWESWPEMRYSSFFTKGCFKVREEGPPYLKGT